MQHDHLVAMRVARMLRLAGGRVTRGDDAWLLEAASPVWWRIPRAVSGNEIRRRQSYDTNDS